MKGIINLVKDAVHQYFNDQQGCKRTLPASSEFSRGRFDARSTLYIGDNNNKKYLYRVVNHFSYKTVNSYCSFLNQSFEIYDCDISMDFKGREKLLFHTI